MTAQKKAVAAALQDALGQARRGRDIFDAARDAVNPLSRGALLLLAEAAIVDHVRATLRREGLEKERSAERQRDEERAAQDAKRAAWESSPEGIAARERRETEWLNERMERDEQRAQRLRAVFEQYEADLKIQWTAELLASEFSLADGTRVTWGEATLAQHTARRDMFRDNAAANMEGAARHSAAIRELERSGADCLANVGVAA